MAKKNNGGLVYSTDPNFKLDDEQEVRDTLAAADQNLRVQLQTKHRAGKAVTVVLNFEGSDADMQDLGKKLKAFCGTGGSAKDGEIIVQGDNREKVIGWLRKNGYSKTK